MNYKTFYKSMIIYLLSLKYVGYSHSNAMFLLILGVRGNRLRGQMPSLNFRKKIIYIKI